MKKHKIMAMALTAAMLMGNTLNVFANTSDIYIDETTAMKVAYGFLNARANDNSVEQQIPEGYSLVEDLTMYDATNKPSAYKFNIVDDSNKYNGYIVIGAQDEYAPVIEFSISEEESFFDNAAKCDKVYYLGGLEYYGQDSNTKKAVNIQSNEVSDTSIKAVLENIPTTMTETDKYNEQWEDIMLEIEDAEKNSISTYGQGDIILNPEIYEQGYNTLDIKTMSGAKDAPYVTVDDYPDYYNHCGPVAITNLMILGYESCNLDLKNGSWDSVFEQICDLAGIRNGNGELVTSEVRDTAVAYAEECGYTNTSASLKDPSVSTMKKYVKNDVLTILQVVGNDIYDDHYVVPYGYEEYGYDDYDNTYFAIADGWSQNTRYVLFDDSFTFTIKVDID